MEELMEELSQQAAENAGTPTVDDGTATDDAPSEAPSAPSAALGGTTDGLCGRFKSEGMSLPSGFSVIGCTTTAGSESLLAMGSTPPKDVCSSLKSWATGSGWNVESEVDMSGTIAMSLKNAGNRMSLSCTDSTGQTSVAISITPG
ncbi:MAG: hypothetical protein Q8P41_05530 [Pseudomonadota bacterium]|nr:hypothetical protein [Pseudomonadota bacterium]